MCELDLNLARSHTPASDRIVSYRIGSVRDSITIITIGYARFTKSQQQQRRRFSSAADTDPDTVSGRYTRARALTCIYNFYKKLKSRSRIKTKLINDDVDAGDRVCVCVYLVDTDTYDMTQLRCVRVCVCVPVCLCVVKETSERNGRKIHLQLHQSIKAIFS